MIIPRIYACAAAVVIAGCIVVCVAVVRPACSTAVRNAKQIHSYYRTPPETQLARLTQRNIELARTLGAIEEKGDTTGGVSGWYDFLQNTLREKGIDAARISGTGGTDTAGVKREDFSIECRASFHTITGFLNACENGKSICTVRDVHLVATSLADSTLQVTTQLSLLRKK